MLVTVVTVVDAASVETYVVVVRFVSCTGRHERLAVLLTSVRTIVDAVLVPVPPMLR